MNPFIRLLGRIFRTQDRMDALGRPRRGERLSDRLEREYQTWRAA